jgi:hypothetical protein
MLLVWRCEQLRGIFSDDELMEKHDEKKEMKMARG